MKQHASKIDFWIVGLLLLIFGIPIFRLVSEKEWLGVFVMSSIFLVIVSFMKSFRYYIGNKTLMMKTAFYRKEIEVSSIRKITALKNVLSTPFATSFDRLEIFYNKYDSVIVSPKDKEAFIKDLLKINAEIEVKM